jgi:hypothetical protein
MLLRPPDEPTMVFDAAHFRKVARAYRKIAAESEGRPGVKTRAKLIAEHFEGLADQDKRLPGSA